MLWLLVKSVSSNYGTSTVELGSQPILYLNATYNLFSLCLRVEKGVYL